MIKKLNKIVSDDIEVSLLSWVSFFTSLSSLTPLVSFSSIISKTSPSNSIHIYIIKMVTKIMK